MTKTMVGSPIYMAPEILKGIITNRFNSRIQLQCKGRYLVDWSALLWNSLRFLSVRRQHHSTSNQVNWLETLVLSKKYQQYFQAFWGSSEENASSRSK